MKIMENHIFYDSENEYQIMIFFFFLKKIMIFLVFKIPYFYVKRLKKSYVILRIIIFFNFLVLKI